MNEQQYNPQQIDYNFLSKKAEDDFNKFIQKITEEINNLDMVLSGKKIVKDEQTGEYALFKISEPMMNDKGREFVKARLSTYCNPNTYMSSLKDPDVGNSFRIDIANFTIDINESFEEYGCSVDNISKITHMVAPVMYFALCKAKTDKDSIYGSMRSNNAQPQQKPPGLFDMPLGGGRGY